VGREAVTGVRYRVQICTSYALRMLLKFLRAAVETVSCYTETRHWWISFVRTTSRTVMWSDSYKRRCSGLLGKTISRYSGVIQSFLDIDSLRSCIDGIAAR
jgi:hypothetical protein